MSKEILFKNRKKIIITGLLIGLIFSGVFVLNIRASEAAERNDKCKSSGQECDLPGGGKGQCSQHQDNLTVEGDQIIVDTWFSCETKSSEKSLLAKLLNVNLGNALFEIGLKITDGVMYGILEIGGALLKLAGDLLDAIFNHPVLQKFTKATIVQTGWQITRDFANMFFALIMIIIAFGTILQANQYGVKQLLPRLIIVALLINFSLVIAGVVIDFSQVLTGYFIDAAKDNGNIGETIAGGLKFQAGFNKTNTPLGSFGESIDGLSSLLIGMFGAIVVIFVAAIVLLAGVFFLIARVIIIWMLLIVAPLVWLFSILPDTKKHWAGWWENFMKWCFFAPTYAFFIWLACCVINRKVFETDIQNAQMLQNKLFGTYSLSVFLNFALLIGILISGLIFASKAGAFGARGAMSLVTKGRDWATGRVKGAGRFATRPAGWAGTRLKAVAARGLGAAIGWAPGLKSAGRQLEAKSKQIRLSAGEEPQHKAYKSTVAAMTNQDVMAETKSAYGIRKLIAAQEAKKRGLVRTGKTEEIKALKDTFEKFRMVEEAKEVGELRPEVYDASTQEGKKQQMEAIERAKANGNINKWGAPMFEGKEGQELMKTLQGQLIAGEFASTFQSWTKQTRDAAEKTMEAMFTDDFSDSAEGKDNKEIRKRYAKATGKIKTAFTNSAKDVIDVEAEKYVQDLNTAQIASLRDDDDFRLASKYITKNQAASIKGEISGQKKRLLYENATPDVKQYMRTSASWAIAAGQERPAQPGPEIVIERPVGSDRRREGTT